jgi:RNA polymerase sigma factor (sigma-70 family)
VAEVLVEHPPHADGQTALLYERYGTRIYRFCLSRLRSREEAEDAVQSTFLRAHGALRQGVVPHSETAWLFKIAQNVCVSRAVASSRRTKVEHAAELEQVNERIPDARRQHDELIGLADALAQMPANLRRPFLLREWKGLSYAEIAEDLGVSQSAVETLIFRARRHLAGALDVTASRLRRAVKALNLGPVLDLMRSLLAGGGAKVAAVVAVATVGAVGVAVVPGSQGRTPNPAPQVAPTGTPGATPVSGSGSRATQPSSRAQQSARSRAAGNFAVRGKLRANGGRLTGTSSPNSAAPRAGTPGIPPTAGPTTSSTPPSGTSSPAAPSGSSNASGPSGSTSSSVPPVVVIPKVPVTPPSGSGGVPEVPVPPLPSLPGVPPLPQVPAVPQVPPVQPPSVPPLPSLTPPPLPVPPPSVPPVPPVPPLPQPPPVPQVVPPPPPVPPLPPPPLLP